MTWLRRLGFKIVEAENTPKEVYNYKIYTTGVVISFGALLFGYCSSFIGTTVTLPAFKRDFDLASLPSDTSANIVSVFQAGAFFGALGSYPIMETIGRKWTLLGVALLFEVSAILQVASTGQIGMIYAGRVLAGLCVGGVTTVCPVYLAELSPPAIRGRLVGFYEMGYQLAAIVGFWINYGIEAHMDPNLASTWRIPMAIQLIPGGMLFAGAFYLVESPRYLLKMNRPEVAAKNLSFLRNLPADHPYVENELSAVVVQINREREVTKSTPGNNAVTRYFRGMYHECSRKGIRNRLIIGALIMFWQNASGINALNYYSPTLFRSIGITDTGLYTGIFGVLKAAASIVFFIWIVDTAGRRLPLMFGGFTSGLCLLYVAIYLKIGHPDTADVLTASTIAGGKGATAFILLFGVFYCFGWNGLAWVICAEIYPTNIRGFCAAWTAMWQWIFQFIVARETPDMEAAMGWGMFLMFAMLNMASVIWVYFVLPETKGRTLEEMDLVFGVGIEKGEKPVMLEDVKPVRDLSEVV
ncbi:MFS transporter, quinate permease [Pseudohyphozyma bogoriensis]|nr:MFS transporter, quinate permease [Pseudohyphozyma bogoriensis]